MRIVNLPVGVAYAALALTLAAPAPQTSISAALDRYAAGDHAAAVATIDAGTLTVGAFTTALEPWIARAAAVDKPKHELVAAAFALDVVWAATRAADETRNVTWQFIFDPATNSVLMRDWSRPDGGTTPLTDPVAVLPVLAWACARLDALQGVTPVALSPAERQWWLASIGVLQNAGTWRALEGGSPVSTADKKAGLSAVGREVVTGHLVHARARLGDDPRVRLADAVAQTARFVRHASGVGRVDVLRDEARSDHRQIAAAQKRVHALAGEQALAGEVAVREGYLELLLRKRAGSLAHFDRARKLTDDPFLVATADYLSGWIHEREGRPAEAIAAYRRAHAFAPRVRNLSTRLAAQLFLTNERAEAYRILDAGLTTMPPAIDLVTLLNRGDARLVPGYIDAMREALR